MPYMHRYRSWSSLPCAACMTQASFLSASACWRRKRSQATSAPSPTNRIARKVPGGTTTLSLPLPNSPLNLEEFGVTDINLTYLSETRVSRLSNDTRLFKLTQRCVVSLVWPQNTSVSDGIGIASEDDPRERSFLNLSSIQIVIAAPFWNTRRVMQ